jgi:hypothetical protein
MKGLHLRHRESGNSVTIYPFDEDHNYWYVNEISDKGVETLRYAKSSWELII